MNNFKARTVTGLSMVFLVLLSIYLSRWMFAAILGVVTILGLLEFYRLVSSDRIRPQTLSGVVTGTAGFILACLMAFTSIDRGVLLVLTLPILFLPFLFEIFTRRENPIENIGITLLGLIYIALPLSLLVFLTDPKADKALGMPAWLLGYFLITWLYDTGAYLFGTRFGKTKFFERISPKKTWEGTLSGAVVAVLTAIGMYYLTRTIPLYDWLALTGIVLVFGTAGDLAESLFKRSLNLKDSGSILPGHGGILDRFDTVFLSAPFVFLYFFLRMGI